MVSKFKGEYPPTWTAMVKRRSSWILVLEVLAYFAVGAGVAFILSLLL